MIAQDGKSHKDVPLWYDATCKKLKSPEWDELLTPVPGEPRAHRSAVAAVVKEAVEILRTTNEDD